MLITFSVFIVIFELLKYTTILFFIPTY